MNRISGMLLVLAGMASARVAASDGTAVIACGDWSTPVADDRGYALRGRLVLCEKPRTDARREVVVYVELQDAGDFVGESLLLFCDMGKTDFRPEYRGGLDCQLRDENGAPVAGHASFGGGVPTSQWVSLPTDGSIRLRATPYGTHREGAIALSPHLNSLWVIDSNDPHPYYLSGTFTIQPTDDQPPPLEGHVWRGTIDLPALRVVGRAAVRAMP